MTTQAVGPGRLLAGRYRVEELLDDTAGVRSWRGVDEVLSRAVFVHTVPSDDARAEPLMTAARAAARVGDLRFLQVLDVDAEDDTVYVVREWVSGQNLKMLLGDGPLAPDQVRLLGREVAGALATAHRQGLNHRRLEPSSVVIAPNGTVKVAGLATEAALHGAPEGEPAEIDAAGIGSIMYAALTGRWPGEDDHGLPPAPRIEDRIASPRQVRPGVPKSLDEVVDRTLGNGERHHAAPITSPAELLEALSGGSALPPRTNGVLGDTGDSRLPPPALVDEPPSPMLSNRASTFAPAPEERPGHSRPLLRAAGVLVSLVFLAGAAWLGWRLVVGVGDVVDDVAQPAVPDAAPADSTPQPTDTPTEEVEAEEETESEPEPLDIVEATAFDPHGSSPEHPSLAPLAIDGDASTAWRTLTYFDPLELQKPGVGLYVDLGEVLDLYGVNLTLLESDADLEIRIAPEADAAPTGSEEDWDVVATVTSAEETVEIEFEDEAASRFLLVWFTRLPPVDGDFSGGIAEVEVLG